MVFNLNLLQEYKDKGLLDICYHDKLPIALFNYSRKCQYDKLWDEILVQMRATVINTITGEVVAKGFNKFFNYEELNPSEIPNESFELFEKLDGSLGILFWFENEPIFCTKGSFYSDQAIKGWEIMLKKGYKYKYLPTDCTYLFEIIYPENRIVCNYGDQEKLVLLACFQTRDCPEVKCGYEYNIYNDDYEKLGFELVKKNLVLLNKSNTPFQDLKSGVEENEEGYVVRFKSGFRMKIKGDEYIRLHKLRSNLNEKFIWGCLSKNIEIPLFDLPDEADEWLKSTIQSFQYGFHTIREYCGKYFDNLMESKNYSLPPRKEYSDWVKKFEPVYQSILFKMYDGKDYSSNIWNLLKPKQTK